MSAEESEEATDIPIYSDSFKPWRLALLIAGLYGAFGSLYIHFSSHIAQRLAGSTFELESIEQLKGTIFILATAFALFTLLYLVLLRIRQKQKIIDGQKSTIIAAEKRAMAGLLASSIAHDLNNLLTVSQSSVEELSSYPEVAAAHGEILEDLQYANREISRYAQRLAQASGKHLASGFREIDLGEAVARAADLAATHKKVKHCAIEREIPTPLVLKVDESIIHRVVLNLVINAADAVNGKGSILLRVRESGDGVRLEVHDNGPGIPPEKRARVFQPFYTTKTDGSGLGLVCLQLCADVHNGEFGVEDSPLGGACFYVVLRDGKTSGARKSTSRQ